MRGDDRSPRAAAGRGLSSERGARVLVVDDEAGLLDLVARTLRVAGFEVATASGVLQAEAVAAAFEPELAVLDVMLPDGSGMDLCSALRARDPEVGVVFLTARDAVEDRLHGFALGGDDYLTKPFSVAELVARVNAVLRRQLAALEATDRSQRLQVADLVLDDDAHTVVRGERAVDLSPTEYRLLHYLLVNAGRVLSKEQILVQVWEYQYLGDASVVEKFVSQLRRKVDAGATAPLIQTVRGFGYVLRPGSP